MCKSIRVHTGSLPVVDQTKMHQCTECRQEFKMQSLLRRHLTRSHQSVNLVGCPECFEMFKDPQELGRHLTIHMQEQPYRCSECPQRFRTSRSLKTHLLCFHMANGKPWSCSLCGSKFRWPSDLRKHERTHSNVRPFLCSQCPWTFKDARALLRHSTIHSGLKPHVCYQCGKAFSLLEGLNRHIRSHYDLRPYGCSMCHSKFKRESHLKEHLLTHNRFSPIVALSSTFIKPEPIGSKISKTKTVKTEAVSNKRYGCPECGESFKFRKEIIRHYKLHEREGLYTCSHCNIEFSAHHALVAHLMTHPNNAIYSTVEAQTDNFSYYENQKSRYKKHSSLLPCDGNVQKNSSIRCVPANPYRCTECGQIFRKSDALWYHLLRHLGRYE